MALSQIQEIDLTIATRKVNSTMPAPRSKPSRAAQMLPEERKKQLLRAGVECFAIKGIGSTKHADLARACQVSVPTVFSYFPNRPALVSAILEEVGSTLLENVINPAQDMQPPDARLPATAPLFTEFTAREPDYVKVWLMWSMHFAPEIQMQFRKFESKLLDALAEMIKTGSSVDDPGQDIHDRARVLTASSAFLAKMVFDGVSEKRREAFAQHILASLMAE
jgi:AcrR family transcriptional regulator